MSGRTGERFPLPKGGALGLQSFSDLAGEVGGNLAIEPFFQPIIRAKSRRIVALEALARLRVGARVMSPVSTLAALEGEPKFAQAFDAEMLDQVLAHCQAWQMTGVAFKRLGWNVGASTLGNPKLCDHLAHLLALRELQPSQLVIECTEAAFVGSGYTQKLRNAVALHEMGFTLVLDDFGAVGSSLSLLREVPCSTVKIAPQFIAGITTNKRDLVLLQGLSDLARGLDLCVVAEGVETEDQAETLQRIGCGLLQGYLFSPPIPGDQVPQLLSRNEQRR